MVICRWRNIWSRPLKKCPCISGHRYTSYYIADQLVKNRNDRALFETVVNDGSRIDAVRGVIDSSISRLAERVIQHLQGYKGVNRIYLTGGGAELIYPAVKSAFPLIKEKVKILPEAQLALVI